MYNRAIFYRRRDYYHTCYCLSGLSLAQHDAQGNVIGAEEFEGLPENLLVSEFTFLSKYVSPLSSTIQYDAAVDGYDL